MEQYQLDKYRQDGQDAKLVEKIHRKILDMLIPGESINYIAIQKKPAVTLLPDSITVSNKRIFLCEFTKLGLATNFEIFFWSDIKDMAFKEEIFGSKVTVIPYTGENLTVDYIPKIQARKLYQLIKVALDHLQQDGARPSQGQQGQENKAPLSENPLQGARPMEPSQKADRPASAPAEGTLNEQSAVPPAIKRAAEPEDEVTKTLQKLKNLYDRQLISQAEYETKKAEILNRI